MTSFFVQGEMFTRMYILLAARIELSGIINKTATLVKYPLLSYYYQYLKWE